MIFRRSEDLSEDMRSDIRWARGKTNCEKCGKPGGKLRYIEGRRMFTCDLCDKKITLIREINRFGKGSTRGGAKAARSRIECR